MDYQVTCPHCRANIAIMAVQVGQSMRCPHCHSRFSVMSPIPRDGSVPLGRVFTFRCGQCQCRLEAYTGMAGQRGQCPTCAAEFRVPAPDQAAPDRTGGTPPQGEYVQPVHAYAAAGSRAPRIVRLADGRQAIECPRCAAVNDVGRDICVRCAAPFTLEGVEQAPAPQAGSHLGLASLILGIVSVPGGLTLVPAILAIVLGVLALRQPRPPGGAARWQPVVGIVLAGLGLIIGGAILLRRMW